MQAGPERPGRHIFRPARTISSRLAEPFEQREVLPSFVLQAELHQHPPQLVVGIRIGGLLQNNRAELLFRIRQTGTQRCRRRQA